MRILLIGSGSGDHFWALHVNRYTDALTALGHSVTSGSYITAHAESQKRSSVTLDSQYDLLVLQDTHLNINLAQRLSGQSARTVLLTHSESIQGKRDIGYIKKLSPDAILTDQPCGVDLLWNAGIPVDWMGHGADLSCRSAEKDIDILWVGHKYASRGAIVDREVLPLLETDYRVKVHGAGYPDGALMPSEMFDVMSRSKLVIHIGHSVTRKYGYSGTRISDALASECFALSSRYYLDRETYPCGVEFCEPDRIGTLAIELLEDEHFCLDEGRKEGYDWCRKNKMATHDMQLMLDVLSGEWSRRYTPCAK